MHKCRLIAVNVDLVPVVAPILHNVRVWRLLKSVGLTDVGASSVRKVRGVHCRFCFQLDVGNSVGLLSFALQLLLDIVHIGRLERFSLESLLFVDVAPVDLRGFTRRILVLVARVIGGPGLCQHKGGHVF